MKLLLLLSVVFFSVQVPGWLTNFEEAKQEAHEKNRLILLNFSGSDWCGPCIRLKNEIFASDAFIEYSNDHLVLVNADFPRSKKNKLSESQVKLNQSLADKFNPDGKFPLTILLDEQAKILKVWDGFPGGDAASFVRQIIPFSNGTH
jgi:thioredoxin-related protein